MMARSMLGVILGVGGGLNRGSAFFRSFVF